MGKHHAHRRHRKNHRQSTATLVATPTSTSMIGSMLNQLSSFASSTRHTAALLSTGVVSLFTQPAVAEDVFISSQRMQANFSDGQQVFGLFSELPNTRNVAERIAFDTIFDNIKEKLISECGLSVVSLNEPILKMVARWMYQDKNFLVLCKDLADNVNQTTLSCMQRIITIGLAEHQDMVDALQRPTHTPLPSTFYHTRPESSPPGVIDYVIAGATLLLGGALLILLCLGLLSLMVRGMEECIHMVTGIKPENQRFPRIA